MKQYYKWIEEGLTHNGRLYTYYIEDGSRITYSIKNDEITQAFVYFVREYALYLHWIGSHGSDSLLLINTIYQSRGIDIVRGIFTYRYKELVNDCNDTYWARFCGGKGEL